MFGSHATTQTAEATHATEGHEHGGHALRSDRIGSMVIGSFRWHSIIGCRDAAST
jgi:hypothetical protein